MRRRYRFLALRTRYWKPNGDYIAIIIHALKDVVEDRDIIVISEKALSTATCNIVDESKAKAGLVAKLLAKYWMRYIWAYFLGPLCHLRKKTINHFRKYPINEGSIHKQVAIHHCNFLQALMHSSEGGIDGSNLPYSYVSLPLDNAQQIAERIREKIKVCSDKNVAVMIVDTDKTYSWRNFHFTHRVRPIKGIHSMSGFIAYIFGRTFELEKRATPLAVVGAKLNVKDALNVAEHANYARGSGAGKTIWDMAETFNTGLTSVSSEMLEKTVHKPIVVVRLHAHE